MISTAAATGHSRSLSNVKKSLIATGIVLTWFSVSTNLFVLVIACNEYLLALFLTIAKAQTLPLTVAAQNATRGPQWWYMSVLILIMIVPLIVMAIVLERYTTRGFLVGAIKG